MSEISPLDAELRDLFRFAAQNSMLPRFRALSDDQIEWKGEDDPVTVVDREVEQFLTEALTKLAPGVAVVGEEAVAADKAVLDHLSGSCWIISTRLSSLFWVIWRWRNFRRGHRGAPSRRVAVGCR